MPTKASYGFSPQLEPFVDKTPVEQVALLQSWGNTAVFGGYENARFVTAAHGVGMKVYAEFGCFVHKRWWGQFPESRPVTHAGTPLEPEDWYYGVNPATPAVRLALLKELEELLLDHAIDGVWLDFIRWPCHWESPAPVLPRTSFDRPTLERFCAETGIPVTQDDPVTAAKELLGRHGSAWTAWRCDQITTWVAEVRALIQRVRPDVLLGLFGVPWRLSDFGGAIIEVIGQDYRALGRYVDVISPMVYHLMCGRSLRWIGDVTAELHALSGKPIWPIIQSVDEPSRLRAAEYGEALDGALNHRASGGVIVFTLKGALEPAKLQMTKAKFQ
jgi:hypothetical protein